MSWSRKDIIADIKKRELDVDISLPYHELKGKYTQARHSRGIMAMGNLGFRGNNNPPPNASPHDQTVKVGDSEEAEVSEQNRKGEVKKCPKGHTNTHPYMFKNNTDRYYCSVCKTTFGIEDAGVTWNREGL